MTPPESKTTADARAAAHQTVFPPAANHHACQRASCSAGHATASKPACNHTCAGDHADQEPERWDGME